MTRAEAAEYAYRSDANSEQAVPLADILAFFRTIDTELRDSSEWTEKQADAALRLLLV